MNYFFIVLDYLLFIPLLGHNLLGFHFLDGVELTFTQEGSLCTINHLLSDHDVSHFGLHFLIVIELNLLFDILLNCSMVNPHSWIWLWYFWFVIFFILLCLLRWVIFPGFWLHWLLKFEHLGQKRCLNTTPVRNNPFNLWPCFSLIYLLIPVLMVSLLRLFSLHGLQKFFLIKYFNLLFKFQPFKDFSLAVFLQFDSNSFISFINDIIFN